MNLILFFSLSRVICPFGNIQPVVDPGLCVDDVVALPSPSPSR